jgi:hypothetical protein
MKVHGKRMYRATGLVMLSIGIPLILFFGIVFLVAGAERRKQRLSRCKSM